MKGILLSAGAGSRLLPLTERVPKCLVAVDGRAILDHQLAALAAAGVAEAVVVGGYRAAQIADHLAAGPTPLPVTLAINPFWAVSSSIGSVWAAAAAGHLDAAFCVLNGDTVFDPAVIAGAVARTGDATALLVEPIATPALDDMLVAVDGGRVAAVAKDLPAGRATHRSLGVVLSGGVDRHYRRTLEAVIAEPDGLHAFHHAIVDRLARTGAVAAIENVAGQWQEIDRPEDIAGWTREHHPPR